MTKKMTYVLLLLSFSCFIGGAYAFTKPDNKQRLDPQLASFIDKVDQASAVIQTMEAKFNQVKEISLLTEPVIMQGRFFLDKEKGFQFNFEDSEDLQLIITRELMVALSPRAKKASRIKVKKRRMTLVQKLLNDKIRSLERHFDISLSHSSEQAGGHMLVLLPAKRKLKKRFQEIRLWTNENHLIHRIKVVLKDGDLYELQLSEIELNQNLPEGLFNTNIPDDFEKDKRMEFIFGTDIGL